MNKTRITNKETAILDLIERYSISHNKVGIESISELLYSLLDTTSKPQKLGTRKIKKMFSDLIFIYDNMRIYENYNIELLKKYDEAQKEINSKTFNFDGDDRKNMREVLEEEKNFLEEENLAKFQKRLWRKINVGKTLPKVVYPVKDIYSLSKELIEKQKYKFLF